MTVGHSFENINRMIRSELITNIEFYTHFSFSLMYNKGHFNNILTLPYLINVHGRLLFSEKISRVDALIRWWTLINFLAKFQGGRLFQCGRLLIFGKMQNAMQCFHTCIFKLQCNAKHCLHQC